MKRTLGKVLAGAVIGSFLMVGSAFALSVLTIFQEPILPLTGMAISISSAQITEALLLVFTGLTMLPERHLQ